MKNLSNYAEEAAAFQRIADHPDCPRWPSPVCHDCQGNPCLSLPEAFSDGCSLSRAAWRQVVDTGSHPAASATEIVGLLSVAIFRNSYGPLERAALRRFIADRKGDRS